MIRRYLALVVVIAAAAIALINPMQLKIQVGETAPSVTTTVKAQDLSLICPGALFQAGGTSGTSLKNTRLGSAAITGAFSSSELTLEGGPLDGRISDATKYTAVDPTGIAKQGSALLNIAQAQLVNVKNLGGLAAANCLRPTSDIWLVGGDTVTGRETLLIMSNASQVDSTVELELLGAGGPISAPGLSGISVPAGKTTVIPVSSLAPNLPTFAVHVTASGGAIGAWLQQRTIRSLVTGGVDYVGAAIDASKTLSIPGIYIRGSKVAEKLISINDDYTDLRPMLRFTNATAKDATVTAQILGANSKTFGTVVQELVPAHSTVDVTIKGLADGDYFAIVNSSEPIRAAMRLSRAKKGLNDFTWLQAAENFIATRAVSSPIGAISKLALVNPTANTATVTVRSGAATATYTLAAKSTVSVVMTPGVASYVTSNSDISANVVIDIDGNLAATTIADYQNLGGTLAIKIH